MTGTAQGSLLPWCARLFWLAGRTVTIGQHSVTFIDVSPAGPDIGPVDALHRGCVHGRAVRWCHIGGGAFRQVAAVASDMRRNPGIVWSFGTSVRPFSSVGVRGSQRGVAGYGALGNGVVVGWLMIHGPAVPARAANHTDPRAGRNRSKRPATVRAVCGVIRQISRC